MRDDTLQRGSERQRRIINDKTARRITRVEELAYELQISEVMTGDVNEFLGANIFKVAAPTIAELRLAFHGEGGRSLVVRPITN